MKNHLYKKLFVFGFLITLPTLPYTLKESTNSFLYNIIRLNTDDGIISLFCVIGGFLMCLALILRKFKKG